MIAVGIDLSLTATAVVRSDRPQGQIIGTPGVTGMSVCDQLRELRILEAEIVDAVWDGGVPDAIVIEGLDASASYGALHERAHLWFSVVASIVRDSDRDLQMWVAPSGCIKQFITGNGSASKGMVIEAVARLLPHIPLRGNDNLADAAAAMAMASHLGGERLLDLPTKNLGGLDRARLIDEAPPKKKVSKK